MELQADENAARALGKENLRTMMNEWEEEIEREKTKPLSPAANLTRLIFHVTPEARLENLRKIDL